MTAFTFPRIALWSSVPLVLLAFVPAYEEEAVETVEIEVTITEGTNMAAALSPDGETVAIDALGRIWVLPASGGTARALTDPLGDARQPTWSPDGERIAFQAYWDGNYHIWSVRPDGSGLEQLTQGPYDYREPHWSPDGNSIVLSSDRSGTYDIWELALSDGTLSRLSEGDDNEYGPAYSPDGRRVAFVSDGDDAGVWLSPGPGRDERLVVLERGAQGFGPSWSPNGELIALNVLTRGTSKLIVAETARGSDLGEVISESDEDVFPFRASWIGNDRLLYTADGRIRTRPSGGGPSIDLPFQATVTLDRHAYEKQTRNFDPEGSIPVRGIVSPAVSPDGESVAFSALGDLWILNVGNPTPEQITNDPWVEVDPAWSPDGSRLAYGSDREGPVDIWLRDMDSGQERRLTEGGGTVPAWSPDGREIAYASEVWPERTIRVVDVATGETRTVRSGLNSPGRPTWSPDGSQLGVSAHWTYSSRFREGVNRILLMPSTRGAAEAAELDPNVQAERFLDYVPHGSVGTRATDGPVWSPDGRWIAYVSTGVLWAIPVNPQGDAVGPPRRLTNEVSDDPSWAGDSKSIVYLTTDRLRRVGLTDGRIEDIPMDLTWERLVTRARTVVHAGEMFDGVSSDVRRNVDVVIEGNRISQVVDHDDDLHEGTVVDASNGVLSPGLIEMHTHGGLDSGERLGRLWLSYGVTSTRTPASDPYETVEDREAVESGRRVGPRLFGTGSTIDGSRIYYSGAPSLTSSAQVELELGRAADLGYDLIKTYVRLADPVQRRIIADAHAMGAPVTSHELYPAVAYGADGVEHVRGTSRRGYSTKVTELYRSYDDVIALLAASGMTITPTVGIYGSYGVLAVDDPSIFDDDRVRTFLPRAPQTVRQRGDVETMRRLVSDMAGTARRVVEAGGTVVIGTDSPIIPEGLSLHAEMEALVRYGGMSPVDVMRATTSVPARAMGYENDLGTIAPGRLADMVVFGANPLDDIRATRLVRRVIKDGVVYEMDELLRRPRDF
jgi:Tol biopolymer transport system component/imidazolonepropionase-like amidohydrolase